MWSNAATQYQVSIDGLTDENWDEIINGAWKVYQEKEAGHTCIASSSISLTDAKMPEADERELLIEASETVDNDEEINWDDCESF